MGPHVIQDKCEYTRLNWLSTSRIPIELWTINHCQDPRTLKTILITVTDVPLVLPTQCYSTAWYRCHQHAESLVLCRIRQHFLLSVEWNQLLPRPLGLLSRHKLFITNGVQQAHNKQKVHKEVQSEHVKHNKIYQAHYHAKGREYNTQFSHWGDAKYFCCFICVTLLSVLYTVIKEQFLHSYFLFFFSTKYFTVSRKCEPTISASGL